MPFFGVRPPPPPCSRRPHETFTPISPSCRAFIYGETRSLRSWFSMPFFGVRPPPLRCSRCPHWTFIPLSPSCKAGSVKSRRACCALMVLDALLWRRTAAVAELSPSRHRAGRTFKSRRARCVPMVLDVLLWRPDAAVVVLSVSPSTLDVYTALAIVQGGIVQVETRALRSRCSMPFFGVGPPPSLSSRRHAIVQGDRSSRDALVVRSWFSMPFFGVGPPPSLCVLSPST